MAWPVKNRPRFFIKTGQPCRFAVAAHTATAWRLGAFIFGSVRLGSFNPLAYAWPGL